MEQNTREGNQTQRHTHNPQNTNTQRETQKDRNTRGNLIIKELNTEYKKLKKP